MNQKRVTLDLSKPPGFVPELRVGRGDRRGLRFVAEIRDNGNAVNLTGMTAKLMARVGGTSAAIPCNVSGNTISCDVDALALGGMCSGFAYVAIRDGGRMYSTERMRVVVVDGNDS